MKCMRGLAAEADAVQSDHAILVLARDTTAQDASEQGAMPDSHSFFNFYTVKSCSCRQTKGCRGSGHDQGASRKRASYLQRLLLSVLLLYCLLLHHKSVMSGYLSIWVGLLSNGVGLFRMGWANFRERGFLKIRPPTGNTVGHAPREISRICCYFLERSGTITCKVTDHHQYSNVRGKGLEVPCIFIFTGKPRHVDKLVGIFRSFDFQSSFYITFYSFFVYFYVPN